MKTLRNAFLRLRSNFPRINCSSKLWKRSSLRKSTEGAKQKCKSTYDFAAIITSEEQNLFVIIKIGFKHLTQFSLEWTDHQTQYGKLNCKWKLSLHFLSWIYIGFEGILHFFFACFHRILFPAQVIKPLNIFVFLLVAAVYTSNFLWFYFMCSRSIISSFNELFKLANKTHRGMRFNDNILHET